MRISDWSSDVCSSDLWKETDDEDAHDPRGLDGPGAARRLRKGRGARTRRHGHEDRDTGRNGAAGRCDHRAAGRSRSRSGEDRKSVVSGKSVSVRVDLGGRGLSKNTTTKK